MKIIKTDTELVLHVGMAPHKLADLITLNIEVANQLLLCMTHTN